MGEGKQEKKKWKKEKWKQEKWEKWVKESWKRKNGKVKKWVKKSVQRRNAGHAGRPNNRHFRVPGLKFGEALVIDEIKNEKWFVQCCVVTNIQNRNVKMNL